MPGLPVNAPTDALDHITCPNFLNLSAPLLDPASTCRDDERLTQGMAVPSGPRPRFKRDTSAGIVRRRAVAEKQINMHVTCEVFRWRLGALADSFAPVRMIRTVCGLCRDSVSEARGTGKLPG